MRKSVRKEYGHHRMYDFEEAFTREQKRVVKKRAHKRLRNQMKPAEVY